MPFIKATRLLGHTAMTQKKSSKKKGEIMKSAGDLRDNVPSGMPTVLFCSRKTFRHLIPFQQVEDEVRASKQLMLHVCSEGAKNDFITRLEHMYKITPGFQVNQSQISAETLKLIPNFLPE